MFLLAMLLGFTAGCDHPDTPDARPFQTMTEPRKIPDARPNAAALPQVIVPPAVPAPPVAVPLKADLCVRGQLRVDGANVTELVAEPGGVRFAASAKGLYRLPAGAGEWERVSMRHDLVNLFVTPAGTLLSGTQEIAGYGVDGTPLLRSGDGGKTWQVALYRDIPAHPLSARPVRASCRSRLYAMSSQTLFSDDGGRSWFSSDQLNFDAPPGDLAVASDDCSLTLSLLQDRQEMSVHRAILNDGAYGKSTEVLKTRGPATLTAQSGGRVAVGAMNGFWWSDDAGRTWRIETAGLADVLPKPEDPQWQVNIARPTFHVLKMTNSGLVFAATWRGLYRFRNKAWRRLTDRTLVDRLELIDGFVFYRTGGVFRCALPVAEGPDPRTPGQTRLRPNVS